MLYFRLISPMLEFTTPFSVEASAVKLVIEASVALSELENIPTVNVSKTFAVSGVDLLRYNASASAKVREVEVELEKKSGLKSIPLKFGLGAVAIYYL